MPRAQCLRLGGVFPGAERKVSPAQREDEPAPENVTRPPAHAVRDPDVRCRREHRLTDHDALGAALWAGSEGWRPPTTPPGGFAPCRPAGLLLSAAALRREARTGTARSTPIRSRSHRYTCIARTIPRAIGCPAGVEEAQIIDAVRASGCAECSVCRGREELRRRQSAAAPARASSSRRAFDVSAELVAHRRQDLLGEGVILA